MNEKEIQDLVLHRDGLILVINKPAGIACHQGPSGGDHIEKYFNHLQYGLPRPPSLAHRLDRDTSGCLILGRHRKALAKLGKLFTQNKIKKKYWAVCYGRPAQDEGVINAPLLKLNTKRGWRIVVEPDLTKGSQEAITEYKLIKYDEESNLSWIEAAPQTGRTHQIRIHLKHIGCAIVGDPFYGRGDKDDEIIPSKKTMELEGIVINPQEKDPVIPAKAGIQTSRIMPALQLDSSFRWNDNNESMLHLHSRSVEIPISNNKPAIFVEALPPRHMLERLKILGYS